MPSNEADRGYEVVGRPFVYEPIPLATDSGEQPIAVCTDCGLLCCYMTELGRTLRVLDEAHDTRATRLPTPIDACGWHTYTPPVEATKAEKTAALKQQLASIAKLLFLLGWPDLAQQYQRLALQETPNDSELYVASADSLEQTVDEPDDDAPSAPTTTELYTT